MDSSDTSPVFQCGFPLLFPLQSFSLCPGILHQWHLICARVADEPEMRAARGDWLAAAAFSFRSSSSARSCSAEETEVNVGFVPLCVSAIRSAFHSVESGRDERRVKACNVSGTLVSSPAAAMAVAQPLILLMCSFMLVPVPGIHL